MITTLSEYLICFDQEAQNQPLQERAARRLFLLELEEELVRLARSKADQLNITTKAPRQFLELALRASDLNQLQIRLDAEYQRNRRNTQELAEIVLSWLNDDALITETLAKTWRNTQHEYERKTKKSLPFTNSEIATAELVEDAKRELIVQALGRLIE